MKKLLFFGAFFVFGFIAVLKGAGIRVVESPVLGYGTPTTVAISSTTWTKVPTSQASGRFGVYIDPEIKSSTHSFVGHLGDCTSTSIAVTVRPFEIQKIDGMNYFPIREDVCLWLLSTNTGAASENVHYQEVKQ